MSEIHKPLVILCTTMYDGAQWMADNMDHCVLRRVIRAITPNDVLGVQMNDVEFVQTKAFFVAGNEELAATIQAFSFKEQLPTRTIIVGDVIMDVTGLDLHILADDSGVAPLVPASSEYRVFGSWNDGDEKVHFIASSVEVKWVEGVPVVKFGVPIVYVDMKE